jgi:ADP-ribose pyrophosphatase YjhB (NUDIX family)
MYCIKCGGKTKSEIINGDNIPRNKCEACNYIHYINPKIIVGALPYRDDRVLLCKRDIHPGFGKWTLPSGFMEMGESLEQGAKREAKEEANLELNLNMLYGTYSIPKIGQVLFIYVANIVNEDFRAADETVEVKLFGVSEIPWGNIAFPSVEFFLRNYKRDFSNGRNFTFHSNFLDQ